MQKQSEDQEEDSRTKLIHTMVAMEDAKATAEASKKYPKKESKVKYTETQQKIVDMLTEDTGVAIMDSGGEGGRAWQRARMVKDYNENPRVNIEVYDRDGKAEVTLDHDTYHYLEDKLEVTPESKKLQKEFEKYQKKSEEYETTDMEDFARAKEDGSYDDYPNNPENKNVYNTYNGEEGLTRTLQYNTFSKNGKVYIILQIHGGADVRGGYTKPQIFELSDAESFGLGNDYNARAGEKTWYTDDGYNWYSDNGESKSGKSEELWVAKDDKAYDKETGEEVEFS